MKEIQVGISSTLLTIIKNNLGEFDLHRIIQKIIDQILILEELKENDPFKHSIITTVYALIDQIMKAVVEEEKPSCRKGCAFCCKMNIDVTPMEVNFIIDYCKLKSIPIDTDCLRKQAAVSKEEIAITKEISSCVFLSKENGCNIYDARPIACRKYVVKTPAELCNLEKYPKGKVGCFIDISAEILTSAIDSIQKDNMDSLPKILLQELGKTQ